MPTGQYIIHITTAGDRWDLLAWQYYGNAALYNPLVMANPEVPIEPVFEAGIQLAVPLLQVNVTQTADLPPWKTLP